MPAIMRNGEGRWWFYEDLTHGEYERFARVHSAMRDGLYYYSCIALIKAAADNDDSEKCVLLEEKGRRMLSEA